METHAHQPEKLEIKIVRSFWSRLWVKLCMVFFLGFFAGILIFSYLKDDKKEANVLNPDIPGAETDSQPADTLIAAETLHYDSPLARAVCKVRYSPKIAEIRVELSSLYPVKSLVEFDVNNLVILNIQHVNVNDQSTSIAAANFVQFNSVGDNKYIILLSNKNSLPHKIDFAISQNDVSIYQNSVQINKD